jgi:hypothetical protein
VIEGSEGPEDPAGGHPGVICRYRNPLLYYYEDYRVTGWPARSLVMMVASPLGYAALWNLAVAVILTVRKQVG